MDKYLVLSPGLNGLVGLSNSRRGSLGEAQSPLDAASTQDFQPCFFFFNTGAEVFEGPRCYHFINPRGVQVVLYKGRKILSP